MTAPRPPPPPLTWLWTPPTEPRRLVRHEDIAPWAGDAKFVLCTRDGPVVARAAPRDQIHRPTTIMRGFRKLDTGPLGPLGTLRVLGLVVVCVVVCMRVQPARARHRHEVARIAEESNTRETEESGFTEKGTKVTDPELGPLPTTARFANDIIIDRRRNNGQTQLRSLSFGEYARAASLPTKQIAWMRKMDPETGFDDGGPNSFAVVCANGTNKKKTKWRAFFCCGSRGAPTVGSELHLKDFDRCGALA